MLSRQLHWASGSLVWGCKILWAKTK